jgi:hypothetical protein
LRSEGEAGLIVIRSANPVEAFHFDHEQGLHDRHLTSPASSRNEKRRPEAALSQKDNKTRIT